jgi:hypothetical protein
MSFIEGDQRERNKPVMRPPGLHLSPRRLLGIGELNVDCPNPNTVTMTGSRIVFGTPSQWEVRAVRLTYLPSAIGTASFGAKSRPLFTHQVPRMTVQMRSVAWL